MQDAQEHHYETEVLELLDEIIDPLAHPAILLEGDH
jgi:hypothetical protein